MWPPNFNWMDADRDDMVSTAHLTAWVKAAPRAGADHRVGAPVAFAVLGGGADSGEADDYPSVPPLPNERKHAKHDRHRPAPPFAADADTEPHQHKTGEDGPCVLPPPADLHAHQTEGPEDDGEAERGG